jgi:hypothetical protein
MICAVCFSAHRHRTGETFRAIVVDQDSIGRNWEFQSEHVAFYSLWKVFLFLISCGNSATHRLLTLTPRHGF